MTTPQIDSPSRMQDGDWDSITHPMPEKPYQRDRSKDPVVDMGNGHKLHAVEYGNPNGEPVLFLHGGPGGGCEAKDARYFDPSRYRVILFDQRGCGESVPTTHTDLEGAMKGNNTAELVEDINAVREHFGINGKMHMEGGSWGSTLALAYAIKHPENVKSLTLRGVFLGQGCGIDYLFQGNAATYQPAERPLRDDSSPEEVKAFLEHFDAQPQHEEGAYRAYMGDGTLPGQIPPEYRASHSHMKEAYARAWDEFVRVIPEEERGNMVEAYSKRLEAAPNYDWERTEEFNEKTNQIDPDYQQRLAFAFAKWEGSISSFSHEVNEQGKIDLGKFADPEFALDFARLEARYARDGFYVSEDGSPVPGGSNYLLDNLPRIAAHNIPMYIVHGANDQVCPVREADELAKQYIVALNVAGHEEPAEVVLLKPERTGHSMREKGNTRGLVEVIEELPQMTKAEKMGKARSAIDHASRSAGIAER